MTPTRLDMTGRTVVITGSSRNLGTAMARILAGRGANVVVHAATSAGEVDAVVSSIAAAGGRAVGVLADLSDRGGATRLMGEARDAFGPVHVLVNNAAVRTHATFSDMDLETWRAVLSVNLDAAFLCCQAVLPDMVAAGWGRIVNISGIDAFWGKAGKAALTSGNLGLIGLARSLAVEYARHGVTVNAVVPGAMRTSRPHAAEYYPGYFERYGEMYRRIPMGRPGEPWELGEVVSFLVSPAAAYVTGQTIHVNGGAFPTSADPFEEPTFPYGGEISVPTEPTG